MTTEIPPLKENTFMNQIIELLPTELSVNGNVPCKGTELTTAVRDFAETFNRCRSEFNAVLEKLRAEDAVLLNRSIECVLEHLTLKTDKKLNSP